MAVAIRICDDQRSLGGPDDSGSRIGDCDEDDDDDEIAAGVIVVRSGRLLWCPCDRRRRRRRCRFVPSRSPGGVAVSPVIAAVCRHHRCLSSSCSRRLCRWAGRPRCPYSPVTYVACSVVVVSLHRTSCPAKVRRTEDLTRGITFSGSVDFVLAVLRGFWIVDRVCRKRQTNGCSGSVFLFFGGLPDRRWLSREKRLALVAVCQTSRFVICFPAAVIFPPARVTVAYAMCWSFFPRGDPHAVHFFRTRLSLVPPRRVAKMTADNWQVFLSGSLNPNRLSTET